MWSAHRLAALVSERSSASSEARNSATSVARRSLVHACRLAVAPTQPEPVPGEESSPDAEPSAVVAPGAPGRPGPDGGSVRILALRNAGYDGKESLTGGPAPVS